MPRVLIVNAGSSSLKWSVVDASSEAADAHGSATWDESEGERHEAELHAALGNLPSVDAAGHRVVHGGAAFREAVVIDEHVRETIISLAELAPLHNPAAVAGIDAVARTFPEVPQVAAFDTAFHATIPDAAAIYPLPREWTQRWGLRRFGFHGLSVQYAVRRSRELLGAAPNRLVVCHLGAGCSVTAVADGESIDTSMGFTPLEGLMMGRRSGSVDPGLLLHLLNQRLVTPDRLDEALNQQSGLLGVSGVSDDMREVSAAAEAGDASAALAQDMFIHRLARSVGAMIAVLGGLDALVFTGGIGEHSPWVRQALADAIAYTGLSLDRSKNADPTGDTDIAAHGSGVRALVVTAREDLTILDEVRRLLFPTPIVPSRYDQK